jgi:L-ascorbate metabolism protein UlaG (beta-lactamase superfamily)
MEESTRGSERQGGVVCPFLFERATHNWDVRIKYVGHACLQIRAGGLTLLCDPWWLGPAYAGQWFQFPPPAFEGVAAEPLDYLYISHGHEDHLHTETLATLPHDATVLVPRLPSTDLRDYLANDLGFRRVIELGDGESAPLGNGVRATIYINLTDSVLVVRDADGRVLVDANDAVHAAPPVVRRSLCERIAEREGPIDYLFCGYGGASFWPNCVHYATKDDLATARLRERQLVDAFVEAVRIVRPRYAFPFAASFALLEPEKRWINDVRLGAPQGRGDGRSDGPGAGPLERLRTHAPDLEGRTSAHFLTPGDVVDDDYVRSDGGSPPTIESLRRALEGPLAPAARELLAPRPLAPGEADRLFSKLAANVEQRYRSLARRRRERCQFVIEVKEAATARPGDGAWSIRMDARGVRVERRAAAEPPDVRMRIRAEVLHRALETPYGVESITIGYGAEFWLRRAEETGKLGLLLTLISCKPSPLRQALLAVVKSPLRVFGYALSQRLPLGVLAATRAGLMPPLVRTVPPAPRLDQSANEEQAA